MAITSESQIIDLSAINNGCAIIEEAAKDYSSCATKIKEAAGICTAEALSVEKKTMQPAIEELGSVVETLPANIEAFTAQIRNVAMQIYNNQLSELAEYRAAQQRRAQEAEAARAANN